MTLPFPHKRQCGDADADARWEGGAQGSVAGVEGGAGGEGVAASATDGGLLVLRMDAFFHVVHLFLVS